jgi:hypothetical protein
MQLLVVRWPSVVGLDAFQFQRLHGGGLALDIFFKPLNHSALVNDHCVHLLHLMLEMREVRFNAAESRRGFFVHERILPAWCGEVESGKTRTAAAKEPKMRQLAKSKSEQLMK